MQFRPMDPTFPVDRQLGLEASPVVLINLFTLEKKDEAALIQAWTDDAQFMQRQPGYISTQLHRGVAGSHNVAYWESTAAFRAAAISQEFQASLSRYPDSAVASRHVCTKVAVPGICDD